MTARWLEVEMRTSGLSMETDLLDLTLFSKISFKTIYINTEFDCTTEEDGKGHSDNINFRPISS